MEGDEECPGCGQLYIYEMEFHCPDCEITTCIHCRRRHSGGRLVCVSCIDLTRRSERCQAEAIWKGELKLGKHSVGVKFYSAVEDRSVHFHLLRDKDKAPIEQRIVRKDTGEDVPEEEMRKAFAVGTEYCRDLAAR